LRTYLVFEPDAATSDATARVTFVRDKFSWPALFFTPVWLLLNRLWLAFVIFCAVEVLLLVAQYYFGLQNTAADLVLLLTPLVVAFEAAQLKAFRLVRRGYREADAVLADDLEGAERRYFERRKVSPVRRDISPSAPPPAFSEMRTPRPVIGLFPERGQ
jgi:hypothetical protein